jgi:hypothetical protein
MRTRINHQPRARIQRALVTKPPLIACSLDCRAHAQIIAWLALALALTLHTLARAPQKVLYWHNQLCLRNQRNRTRWILYRSSVG